MTGPHRSAVLDTTVRLVFHSILLFGVYLLFAGHNGPGGGFVGGLACGAAFVLRYLAGGPTELRRSVPVDPGALVGLGVVTAALTGLGSLLAGGAFLQSASLELDLPVLGHLKLVSALAFDVGVFLVVVGLVLGLLRSFGRAEP